MQTSDPLLSQTKLPAHFGDVEHLLVAQRQRCTTCNSEFHVDSFPRRYNRKGELVVMKTCRSCRRKNFSERPGSVAARQCIEDARNQPCADCGQRYPLECMQLVPPPDAPFSPTTEAGRCSLAKLRAVVKTCRVVCANCRAIRDAARRKSRRPASLKVKGTPELRRALEALFGQQQTSQTLADSPPASAPSEVLTHTKSQSLAGERVGEWSTPKDVSETASANMGHNDCCANADARSGAEAPRLTDLPARDPHRGEIGPGSG